MSRRAPLSLAAVTLLALAGCSTPPAPETEPAALATRRALVPWGTSPERVAVRALTERCQALLADGTPILRAELSQRPEVAHQLFLELEDGPLRAAILRALDAPAYAASERVRAEGGEPHAQARALLLEAQQQVDTSPASALESAAAATARFLQLRDPLLVTEAALVAAAAARSAGVAPALPAQAACPVQEVVLAFLHLGGPSNDTDRVEATLAALERSEHLPVALRLAELRQLGGLPLSPPQERKLVELQSRIALRRRDPLRAARFAAEWARLAQGAPQEATARVRLAQAYLAGGREEDAVLEAQTAAERAEALGSLRAEAAARAALGDALLQTARAEAAGEAYARAQSLFEQAGDGPSSYRQALNGAAAQLRAGETNTALSALRRLGGVALAGASADALRVRRDVLLALGGLLAGALSPADARAQVHGALARARRHGCLDVLRAFEGLEDRLEHRAGG